MLFRVVPWRRTYAEPGGFAIFARGSEVESDQRSRVVRRRTFAELGWGGVPDFWSWLFCSWRCSCVLSLVEQNRTAHKQEAHGVCTWASSIMNLGTHDQGVRLVSRWVLFGRPFKLRRTINHEASNRVV